MLSAGAALIGILVGAVAASVVLLGWSRSRVRTARSEREKLLGDAQREAEALRREAQVEAREQAVALRSEIESEVQDRRVADREGRGARPPEGARRRRRV